MTGTAARIVTAAEIEAATSEFSHSLDPASRCRIAPVSRLAGMAQSAVNVVTVAPGDRAFPLHRHHVEEEWTLVLSGTATVRVGDATHTLGPGDFVAFPGGTDAHAVVNASAAEPLVCLMGGHDVPADLVDFPELGVRITKSGRGIEVAPADAFGPFRFRAPPEDEG